MIEEYKHCQFLSDGRCHPILKIRFGIRGMSEEEDAYVDTGYRGVENKGGYLLIPDRYKEVFGPSDSWVRHQHGGTKRMYYRYLGEVEVVGIDKKISAWITCGGDRCYIGRNIIDKLEIKFNKGKTLEVEI